MSEIKFEKFDAKIGEVGVFNSWEFIKVVWVDFVSNKVNELQKKISEVLKEYPEDKIFSSHITTIRVNNIKNKEKFIKELKKINFKKLDFEAIKFVLIKSELTPRGPMYKTIKEFELI
jgi:2'-5' RNA ligase